MSTKDLVLTAVTVALLGGLAAGCTPGGDPATAPSSGGATIPASPVPTQSVPDFAALKMGDTIPVDQVPAAQAAGVHLVSLPITDPDHAVVVTPGNTLPEAVKDEIRATKDPMAVTDTAVEIADAGVHVIFLSEVTLEGSGRKVLQFRVTEYVANIPGWDENHNPVTEQDVEQTHDEAMAFIQPWLKDFPVEVIDLTQ